MVVYILRLDLNIIICRCMTYTTTTTTSNQYIQFNDKIFEHIFSRTYTIFTLLKKKKVKQNFVFYPFLQSHVSEIFHILSHFRKIDGVRHYQYIVVDFIYVASLLIFISWNWWKNWRKRNKKCINFKIDISKRDCESYVIHSIGNFIYYFKY